MLLVWAINLLLMLKVQGFIRGAPKDTCGTMLPLHGVDAKNTTPPFEINVSSLTYTANQRISVSIIGKGMIFEGFLLVARSVNNTESFGRFIPVTATKGLSCSNREDSGITHTDNSKRPNLTFTWEAPATDEGDIQMIATVVRSKKTFWLNVTSEMLTPVPGGFTSPPPLTTTPSPQQNEIKCQSRYCLISWLVDKDAGVTTFNLSLEVSNVNMYIAVGLSYDQNMGHDSVVECLRYPNGSIIAQMSYNDGRKNLPVESGDAIHLSSTSFENGVMSCSFTRKNTVNNSKIFNILGRAWYLLVAIGDVDLSKPTQKKFHSIYFASSSAIDLEKSGYRQDIKKDNLKGILISVHGSLMIFAWIFFASVGMFTARYFKSINKQVYKLAFWFQLHRFSMVFTLLFTVTGFIIIFVAEGEYSESVGLPYDAHPILGIIVTFLTLLNPIMAFFRPDKNSSKRIWFNWAHRSVGAIAFILADATMFIGIFWFHRSIDKPKASITVMIFFIAYKCLAVFTMELIDCWKERSVVSVEMDMSGNKTQEKVTKKDFGRVKTVLLICHIIITLMLSVLLVIFLNVSGEEEEDHDHDEHDH